MKTKGLPKTLFVVHFEADGDDYYTAVTDTEHFNDGDVVGTYVLESTGTKRVDHRIVPATAKRSKR